MNSDAYKVKRAFQQGPIRGPTFKGDYNLCCPFFYRHDGNPDTKFKLSVNPELGIYHCFRCGSKGKVEFDETERVVKELPKQDLSLLQEPDGCIKLTDSYAKPYRKYLKERSLLDQCINIGVLACIDGKYAGRIIIPHILNNEWHGFAARTIYKKAEPKYLNAPGMDRRHTLFGYHFKPNGPRYLVEGPLDAVALYPHAVASFGKNVTDEQILLLEDLKEKIIVCLDGDAWEEGYGLYLRLLMRGVNCNWCKLPPGEDPGKLGSKVKKYIQP